MSWAKFSLSDGFQYYKVIRSQTKSNPVYPEDAAKRLREIVVVDDEDAQK
jgi:hypothetical protein